MNRISSEGLDLRFAQALAPPKHSLQRGVQAHTPRRQDDGPGPVPGPGLCKCSIRWGCSFGLDLRFAQAVAPLQHSLQRGVQTHPSGARLPMPARIVLRYSPL